MGGFDINKAARLMRAGDAFSKTNEKLVGAAIDFVRWLFEKVGEFELKATENEGYGWHLRKDDEGTIALTFKTQGKGWGMVIYARDSDIFQINQVIELCQALEGPGGVKLVEWLEQEIREHEHHLMCLQGSKCLAEGKY